MKKGTASDAKSAVSGGRSINLRATRALTLLEIHHPAFFFSCKPQSLSRRGLHPCVWLTTSMAELGARKSPLSSLVFFCSLELAVNLTERSLLVERGYISSQSSWNQNSGRLHDDFLSVETLRGACLYPRIGGSSDHSQPGRCCFMGCR
jgi:hypothetical protein